MKTAQTGRLYLIPVPLAGDALQTLSPQVITAIHGLRHFVVENARTARRFISTTNPPYRIDELEIVEIGKHDHGDPAELLAPLFGGLDMGMMSEAGCPGIADPGSELVRFAHEKRIKVIPLTGPSSILLALMASGLGGQQFSFHGYLAPKRDQLASDLRRLEGISAREHATQIFIETPYRNAQVMETALQVLGAETRFCVAVDLTSDTEWIRSMTIREWRQTEAPNLHKRPAVFCLKS